MINIINRYIEKIKKEHSARRKVISFLLCMAIVVSVGVFWNLRLTGISMTTDVACNIEEHLHDEACSESVLICSFDEAEEHTHDEACYETQLICEKEEHAHTVTCLPDETADVEIASDWEKTIPSLLLGDWSEDVLTVAKSQLGYTESERNFIIDEADNSRKGYTRYGQWYGNLYGDWNTMFMAFCLEYGKVPEEAIPVSGGCYSWETMLIQAGLYQDVTDYIAETGDIVFFDIDEDGKADKTGIVSEVTETEMITVEGDCENTVAYVTYNTENMNETGIVGVLDLNDAYLAYSELKAEELALAEKEEGENEVAETEAPVGDEVMDSEAEDASNETEVPADAVATESTVVDEENKDVETETEETVATKEPEEEKESFEVLLARFSFVQSFADVSFASTIVDSNKSGSVSWILDSDGVLTISGSGSITTSVKNQISPYSSQIKKIVIEEGITSIGSSGLNNLQYFTELILPKSMTSIGQYAFSGSTALARVSLNEGLTTIGNYAFEDCTSLTELEIPTTLTSIGTYAFYESKIKKIVFNAVNLKTIYWSSFYRYSLETLIISDSVDYLPNDINYFLIDTEEIIFESPNIIDFEANTLSSDEEELPFYIISGPTYIDTNGVMYSIDTTNMTAKVVYCPEDITTLNVPATLVDPDNSTKVYTVNGVGSYAFKMADNLTSVVFTEPKNITVVDAYGFAYCPSLISVNSKNYVDEVIKEFNTGVSIGDYAFSYSGLLYGNSTYPLDKSAPIGSNSSIASGDNKASIAVSFATDSNYSANEGVWRPDEATIPHYYELETGVPATVTATFEQGASGTAYEYRIYVESTGEDFDPGEYVQNAKITHINESSNQSIDIARYESGITGVYYLVAENFDAGEGLTFNFNIGYDAGTTAGGGVRIWAALVPTESTDVKYIPPTNENAIEIWWVTEALDFSMTKSLHYTTKNLVIEGNGKGDCVLSTNLYYEFTLEPTGTLKTYGQDNVKWMDFTDTLDLPDGITWPQEYIDAVKEGNYSYGYDPNYYAVCFYINNREVGYITTYGWKYGDEYYKNFSMEFDDDGNLTFNIRVLNIPTSTSGSYALGGFDVVLYGNRLKVDLDTFRNSTDHNLDNSASATLAFMSGIEKTYTAVAETFEVKETTGILTLNKDGDVGSSSYGDEELYEITVSNNSAANHIIDRESSDDGYLVDELNSAYYITPENMEKMLNETYGKTLSISINNARLCNDSTHKIAVSGAKGDTAYKTVKNCNDITCDNNYNLSIYWKDESIVVDVENGDTYTVDSETTLSDIFNNIGYRIIDIDSSLFTLKWDMTQINSGLIYGGESRVYNVYTTAKNTFEYTTTDIKNSISSKAIYNYANADFGSEYDLLNEFDYIIYSYDAKIAKSLSIGGVSYTNADFIINNGDVADYTLTFTSTIGTYENLPIVDTLTGAQKLLVPKAENTALADKGLNEITVDGVAYYQLKTSDTPYTDVYVGYAGSTLLKAAEVNVSDSGTTVKWYFSSTGSITIKYKALVDCSDEVSTDGYTIGNTVWVNDKTGSRIYANINDIEVNLIKVNKEIYDRQKGVSLGSYSLIKKDNTSVSYRLSFESLASNKSSVSLGIVTDVLPNTYGSFVWSKDNVKLEFDGGTTVTSSEFDKWELKQDETTGEYIIYWPTESTMTFEGANTAYVYVELKFPTGEGYDNYVTAVNGATLSNTLKVMDLDVAVEHDLSVTNKVYMQHGVYNVYRNHLFYYNKSPHYTYRPKSLEDSNWNYYSNSTFLNQFVDYYVAVYNEGPGKLFLGKFKPTYPNGFTYVSGTTTAGGYLNWPSGFSYKSSGVTLSNSQGFYVSKGLNYDENFDSYYLAPGEALAFKYSCKAPSFLLSNDKITSTVTMEYLDYLEGGFELIDNLDVKPTMGTIKNDGECDVVDGKYLVSSVSQIRGDIKPGISKSVVNYTDKDGKEWEYNGSVPNNTSINWKVNLDNDGYAPICNYTLTDTMEAPYTFVTGSNVYAILKYYDENNRLIGYGALPLKDTARTTSGGVSESFYVYNAFVRNDSITKKNGVKITANVDITTASDGTETLTINFEDYRLGIPNEGYMEIYYSTINNTTTSYTKVFANEATLTPNAQEFNEYTSGIVITDEETGEYESVSTYAFVNVINSFVTSSSVEVLETVRTTNTATSQSSDNIITLNPDSGHFRYTMTVGAPDEVALNKLVIIDNLPNLNDHSPFNEDIERGSEYKVDLDVTNPDFEIKIKYEDGTVTTLTDAQYIIEYSTKDSFTDSDRYGTSSDGWSLEIPEDPRNIRVIIVDGSEEKGLMPLKSQVSVSFNAKINNLDSLEPGMIAWNNFGYYYEITQPNTTAIIDMESMPLSVGVRTPSYPTIQKELIYQEGTSYVDDEKDLEFTFLVHEGTALSDYSNLTADDFGSNEFTVATVTVPKGASESEIDKELLENAMSYEFTSDGNWEATTNEFPWSSGATYTIYELPDEDFSLSMLVGQQSNAYSFTYDPEVERVFVCENTRTSWDLDLTKTDRVDTTKLLPGAGFAVYSENASEKIAVPESLSAVLDDEIQLNGTTWYLANYLETDANGKLTFEGLKSEAYYLMEYKAPNGYYMDYSGGYFYFTDTVEASQSTTIDNVAGIALPHTGGDGTDKFMVIGLAMISASLLMATYFFKKKSNLLKKSFKL